MFREYTTISNPEQKKRYKDEFYGDYDEYRRLHSEVLVTANRFTYLYTLLQGQKASGNMIGMEVSYHNPQNNHVCRTNEQGCSYAGVFLFFQETTEQIVREYKETKQNRVYQQMKERFDYLHNKLSHIKRLILEYDTENADRMSIATNTIDNDIMNTNFMNNGSNNTRGIDNRHY